jgi:hypothetical protein
MSTGRWVKIGIGSIRDPRHPVPRVFWEGQRSQIDPVIRPRPAAAVRRVHSAATSLESRAATVSLLHWVESRIIIVRSVMVALTSVEMQTVGQLASRGLDPDQFPNVGLPLQRRQV